MTSKRVKLLRLLQEGEYYPLGADQPKQRELGCADLFDALGEELKRSN